MKSNNYVVMNTNKSGNVSKSLSFLSQLNEVISSIALFKSNRGNVSIDKGYKNATLSVYRHNDNIQRSLF